MSIFSIAHLGDAERMFFVSLLLNQIVGWMRAQTGTSSLRAIVYMDEIAGYFPPVANPPSKPPLLTLLKQARAFGVGVVLATQNPVDLDYKGLSNTGTWFLGRLQTERDKARVLDGLEGAAGGIAEPRGRRSDAVGARQTRVPAAQRPRPSRRLPDALDDVVPARAAVAGSDHDAHGPSGPLASGCRVRSPSARSPQPVRAARREGASPRAASGRAPRSAAGHRAVLRPGCSRRPQRRRAAAYTPVVLGAARVTFSDAKLGIDETRDVLVRGADCRRRRGGGLAERRAARRRPPPDLQREPRRRRRRSTQLPAAAQQPKNYAAWQKSFSAWLLAVRTHRAVRATARRS